MLAKAEAAKSRPEQQNYFDFRALSNDELWALEAILAKAGVNDALGGAGGRQPYKPELLEPETLARTQDTCGRRLQVRTSS